jgi:hypothetical protein
MTAVTVTPLCAAREITFVGLTVTVHVGHAGDGCVQVSAKVSVTAPVLDKRKV